MDENVIFFMGFPECFKEDTGYFPLVKAKCPVVGSADQVVRIDVLYDP
jgi:hypothetical protein